MSLSSSLTLSIPVPLSHSLGAPFAWQFKPFPASERKTQLKLDIATEKASATDLLVSSKSNKLIKYLTQFWSIKES